MSDLSYSGLIKNDPLLANIDVKKWAKIPSDDIINKTVKALQDFKYNVTVVNTKAEALELAKKTIPKGVSVQTPSSTTLKEICFQDYLKVNIDLLLFLFLNFK